MLPSMPRDAVLPKDFQFGVATAGFQVEGGYNGPGDPANNWSGWEREGRVEPSGVAVDFWNRYEEILDRVSSLGCDSFRMSVEWARCEPESGQFDDTAFARYAAILDACLERGLEPLVTLHHFTHPDWLGEAFWLQPDSPERFAAWAHAAVSRLSDRCSHWVTLNEINILPVQSFLLGGFPPGRRGDMASALRAFDHLLAAHVLAHATIHSHQPDASVSTNNGCSSIYELDRLFIDILLSRSSDVGRHYINEWLRQRRKRYYSMIGGGNWRETALRRLVASTIPLERALPRAVAAVHDGPAERPIDSIQIDYYDPVASNHVRVPGHRSAGGRVWDPGRRLWDDMVNPPGMATYLAANCEPGMGLQIVENGLCNRVRNGRSYPRLDGWTRPAYLRRNLATVLSAMDRGIPVTGYWHWSLVDNYEWGSYEPRFGLFGVDRARGIRWSELDSMGQDAAGAYKTIIEGLRTGDRSVLGQDV